MKFECNEITYDTIDDCVEYDLKNIDGTTAPCLKCGVGHYLLEDSCININTFDDSGTDHEWDCKIFKVIDEDAALDDHKYGC